MSYKPVETTRWVVSQHRYMTLFSNKYRVETARLNGWDYSNTGIYYVTICTINMKKYFGNIINGKIYLTEAGNIVNEEWLNTAIVRKNVVLDEFVVMPNHFHGIIALTKIDEHFKPEMTHPCLRLGRRVVSTSKTLKPDSLGSIIGQFKSKCTKRILEINKDFKWQDRFHDRIIRNEKELDNVREYIHYNPEKWSDDEFYSE